jgi:hypothetical protein
MTRVSVMAPGAQAHELVSIGRAADRLGLDGLWIGSPDPSAPHSADSYALTAAAAVAAVTRHLRLGCFLHLDSRWAALRAAEDCGVVDNLSGGRLAVALPDGAATLGLGGWEGWHLPDGSRAPVTPYPAQPGLPRLVLDRDLQLEEAPGEDLVALAARLDATAVREVAFRLDPADALPTIELLAYVVMPCLRCAREDLELLAQDAYEAYEEHILRRLRASEPS